MGVDWSAGCCFRAIDSGLDGCYALRICDAIKPVASGSGNISNIRAKARGLRAARPADLTGVDLWLAGLVYCLVAIA